MVEIGKPTHTVKILFWTRVILICVQDHFLNFDYIQHLRLEDWKPWVFRSPPLHLYAVSDSFLVLSFAFLRDISWASTLNVMALLNLHILIGLYTILLRYFCPGTYYKPILPHVVVIWICLFFYSVVIEIKYCFFIDLVAFHLLLVSATNSNTRWRYPIL